MITLTESAANRIKRQLGTRATGLGISVGVKTTGCSGLGYVLEFVDAPLTMENVDMSFVSRGIHIFVNQKDRVYLEGLEMDYVRQGLNEGFDFKNPQELDRCGCGESFRVSPSPA